MKKILVPCDFSETSIQAFKFAVAIADQNKSKVYVLHVIEIPVVYDSLMMPNMPYEDTYLKRMKERANQDFEKMKKKWSINGLKIKLNIEYGATTPVISQFIETTKIDLVVMGTEGASGWKGFFVGSNTEKIVRWSKVPVIAIKKSVKLSSIRNIVFPTTLHEEDGLMMRVKALQTFFKAKLHVVYVNTPANFSKDSRSLELLNQFAKRFLLKEYTLNIYNDLSEEAGVSNFTSEIKGDMVAMATQGRTGLNRLLSGSIAEDVVNHIECPIWTWKTT